MRTSTTPEASPDDVVARVGMPALYHVVLGVWVVVMLLLAWQVPETYEALLEEDRAVEWATVLLFGAAGIAFLVDALRRRLVFTGLVGLFCLFVAGEEFSWGQRLLGYGSPEYFLANNYQQELNLHNLPGAVVKPKWIFIIALGAYGLLLPIAARMKVLRRVLERLRIEPPPLGAVPWYAVAIGLLLWYPATLTGEWTECLAGAVFLGSAPLRHRASNWLLAASVVFGIAMTELSGSVASARDVPRKACTETEVRALLEDLSTGAARHRLMRKSSVHKRLWGAIQDDYVAPARLRRYGETRCDTVVGGADETRRRYFVDIWGVSYWMYYEDLDDGTHRLGVYSFGPNRRRDGESGWPEGDDVAAMATFDNIPTAD